MKSKKVTYNILALFVANLAYASHCFAQKLAISDLPSITTIPTVKVVSLPDFSKIADVKTKKEHFFLTLYPIIEEENQHVLSLRKTISALNELPALNNEQTKWLEQVASYYKIKVSQSQSETIDALLLRVDFIPPALALTQAAIESGWGASRFSRKGNNLFGQWCFSKGCGLVPSSRDSENGHEVAKFSSVNAAVRSYIRNLNTNVAYKNLRVKRAELRQKNVALTGVILASELSRYSQEKQIYVQKLKRFLRQNNLQRFNQQFAQVSL